MEPKYVNPVDALNKARLDHAESVFTKRETMAMHLYAALIDSTETEEINYRNLAMRAVSGADILLETLRNQR